MNYANYTTLEINQKIFSPMFIPEKNIVNLIEQELDVR